MGSYMGRSTRRWGAVGAAFGACFPLMALGIRCSQVGAEGVSELVQSDPLLWIIGTAPLFLGAFAALGGRQQDKVSALNEGLEAQVAERTGELRESVEALADRAAEQSSLLAGLELGLVCFRRDGTLSSVRSQAFDALFEGAGDCPSIDQLLARFAGLEPEDVAWVREMLWDPEFHSPFQDTVAMIQGRSVWQGRTLERRFAPIHDAEGQLSMVLLQVLDISEQLAALEAQAEATARMERLGTASRSVDAFRRFVRESEALFQSCGEGCSSVERARAMHTLKGNARSFGFHEVAHRVHLAEDLMAAGGVPDPGPVSDVFHRQVQEVCDVLGLNLEGDQIMVSAGQLDALTAIAPPALKRRLERLSWQSPHQQLSQHLGAVRRLARQRGVELDLGVEGPRLPVGTLAVFDVALTHILTNGVVHAARPDRPLRVLIRVLGSPQELVIEVKDDGKGIDHHRLAAKAVQSGLWTPGEAEVASVTACQDLVFAAGLSSRDKVDEAAGRGVGLDAVRADLEALGGSAQVRSVLGEGTRFLLSVPRATLREAA